jgi:SnoaL-like domain
MSKHSYSTAAPAGSELSDADQRRLLDKLAVQETLDRYWFGLGQHDVESVLSAFSPDARYAGATGQDKIRAIIERISGLRCINILRGSQLITIEDDQAKADTQAVAFVVVPHNDGDRLIVQGIRYVDRLVRTPTGWLIADRGGLDDRTIAHDVSFEFQLLTSPTSLTAEMASAGKDGG